MLLTIAIIFGVIYLAFGVYSMIFYINDFVIEMVKEEGFSFDMIIVMLMALLVPPLYWFIRALLKSAKIF